MPRYTIKQAVKALEAAGWVRSYPPFDRIWKMSKNVEATITLRPGDYALDVSALPSSVAGKRQPGHHIVINNRQVPVWEVRFNALDYILRAMDSTIPKE